MSTPTQIPFNPRHGGVPFHIWAAIAKNSSAEDLNPLDHSSELSQDYIPWLYKEEKEFGKFDPKLNAHKWENSYTRSKEFRNGFNSWLAEKFNVVIESNAAQSAPNF